MPRGIPDIDWRNKKPCPRCGSRTQAPHACDIDRIAELEAALRKINALNDSPARFDCEIQAVLNAVIDTSDVKFK